MRLAGIDIGTNTLLLLVADIDERGRIEVIEEAQELPRLGKGVDRSAHLSAESLGQLAEIVDRYARIARGHGVEAIAACATSAIRDAVNRKDAEAAVLAAAGVELEIIDGPTEALLMYRGALTGPSAGFPDPIVIDIGGGSTEFCYAPLGATNGGRMLTAISLDIGSVRLTERYFRQSPPGPAEIESARQRIIEDLAQVRNPGFQNYTAVAVAGAATTLAGLHLGLDAFDRERIDGCSIPGPIVGAMAARLLAMDAPAIRELSGLTRGREDILAAGALILSEIAVHFGFREIRVSTRGLRYGIVLREWERRSGAGGRFA